MRESSSTTRIWMGASSDRVMGKRLAARRPRRSSREKACHTLLQIGAKLHKRMIRRLHSRIQMRHIKGQEGAAMYSQAAMTSSRNAAFMPAQPVERAPTLQDVFRGQPVDSYSAGAAIFWEGDTAGHIFDVL